MENTYREYAEWLGEEVELETRQKYEKAKKKLQQLMSYENELVRSLCHFDELRKSHGPKLHPNSDPRT